MSSNNNKLMRELSIISAFFYLLLTGLAFLFSSSASAISQKHQESLIYLLQQDCGSCHGLTLQGGLGPSLLQNNLRIKNQLYLETVIANGISGTPMPPWKTILNPEEISFISEYLLSEKNVLTTYTPQTETDGSNSNSSFQP